MNSLPIKANSLPFVLAVRLADGTGYYVPQVQLVELEQIKPANDDSHNS
jgi:hypothetical protein